MTHTDEGSIRIIAYDGHRADVRPKKIVDNDLTLDIIDIEDAWVETGVDPASPVIHGFVVRCSGGRRYRVRHRSDGGWSAERLTGTLSAL